MGGYGSGRWQTGKGVTAEHRSIDVRRLQRDRLLTPGRTFAWNWTRDGETLGSVLIRTEADRLALDYRHRSGGGDWQPLNYSVRLDWTPCTYGGRRAWFQCPAAGCGRRVALLYLGSAGIFACRHCYQLAYACQRETNDDRATRRADRIRERLAWEPGILNGEGWKPKGMHWRTYHRLVSAHDSAVAESLAGMRAWLARRGPDGSRTRSI